MGWVRHFRSLFKYSRRSNRKICNVRSENGGERLNLDALAQQNALLEEGLIVKAEATNESEKGRDGDCRSPG